MFTVVVLVVYCCSKALPAAPALVAFTHGVYSFHSCSTGVIGRGLKNANGSEVLDVSSCAVNTSALALVTESCMVNSLGANIFLPIKRAHRGLIYCPPFQS